MDPDSLHGKVGTNVGGFSRLLPEDNFQPTTDELRLLANLMKDQPDTLDDTPDPEENLMIPAGYTYLGQFIDHDLTFDTTSSLNPEDTSPFTNQRTPRFDLDNVYGPGPDAAPFMYSDGVHLISSPNDLPRSEVSFRAIIGDPRNDENSIVCNIQMAFINFHNAVVDLLAAKLNLSGKALFKRAQQEVRWTYQNIIVKDFLPRIVSNETLQAFEVRRAPSGTGLSLNDKAFALFTPDKRGAIPIEFSAAAYRFGHSLVRNGYRLNAQTQLPIFLSPQPPATGPGSLDPDLSLVGFQKLPLAHVISDWTIFFPATEDGPVSQAGKHNDRNNVTGPDRLQYSYRMDTTLGDPLAHLPQSVAGSGETEFRLAARNLLRGAKFGLASGQTLANTLGVPVLPAKYLVVRTKTPPQPNLPFTETFVSIPADLQEKTPLWFYILAEAQVNVVQWWMDQKQGRNFTEVELNDAAAETTTQLGEAGGRVVLEVFHGLLDSDAESYRNDPLAGNWQPLIRDFTMLSLLTLNFK